MNNKYTAGWLISVACFLFLLARCTTTGPVKCQPSVNLTDSLKPIVCGRGDIRKTKSVLKNRLMEYFFPVPMVNGNRLYTYHDALGFWHKIGPGDSIFGLGRRFSVKRKRLMRVNGISRKTVLQDGRSLFIPYHDRSSLQLWAVRSWPLFIMSPPCRGMLTSDFGYRRFWGGPKMFHKGIDIGAQPGEPVYAAQGGRVVLARRWGRYGKIVRIRHNKRLETRYAHLSEITVKRGDRVLQGGLIGRVGKTGASTGYHIHFEVRYQGKPVNPLSYLSLPEKKTVRFANGKKGKRIVFSRAGIMPTQIRWRYYQGKTQQQADNNGTLPSKPSNTLRKHPGNNLKALNRLGENNGAFVAYKPEKI